MEDELADERNNRIRAVFDAKDSERQRLSRELHDGLGQQLVAGRLILESSLYDHENNLNTRILEVQNIFDQIIRDGIKALLSGFEDIEVVAEAGSAVECLQKLRFHPADLALINISLPGISGIKLTEQLAETNPALKVLILSMHLNEAYISGAIKAGAMGYLVKNTTREELIRAIHIVSNGDKYLGKEVSDLITSGFIRRVQVHEDEVDEVLSKRGLEILRLTAEAIGNKEISEKLFISIRTVKSHKNHIMQKLGLKSSVEMVRYAIKTGLINI